MTPLRLLGRVVLAGLLGTTAGIHLYLYLEAGYHLIPTIGPLFIVNAVSGGLLALAVLLAPWRWLRPTALAAALFEFGTLAALAISTWHGLFGWQEFTSATLYWPAVGVEAAGTVVGIALAAARRPEAPPRVSITTPAAVGQ